MKRSSRRLVLVVIAGPNGAGKTEFTHSALGHEWLAECEHINPDEIARDVFGSWDDEKAVLDAMRHAENIRRKCLTERRSLVFETVFSTGEKIQFIRQAKQAGYFVRFFFIATDTPQINAARIAKRVAQGGHDVPTRKGFERFYKSVGNLVSALRLVDRGYVYDNSVDGESPALQFRTDAGQIKKIYRQNHDWAEQVRQALTRGL